MSAGSMGNEMGPPMSNQGPRRPNWRKSKQEIIDEKVERLFETYKLMDEMSKK